MVEVALRACVSTSTVSRVLTASSSVAAPTRERVLRAVRELNYRPNAVARSLRVERTHTLGLILGDVLNPFFTELSRAVEDAARRVGYSLIVGNADEDSEREDRYARVLLDRRVDGLLVSPAAHVSPALNQALQFGVPIVLVDRGLDGAAAPTIRADGRPAIDDLIAHLVGLGHERIAIVSGPRSIATGAERLDAFEASLARRDLALPASYVELGDFRAESGERAMERLLRLARPPSAVFVADNLMTLGALRAIRRHRLRVGVDIALASFDDIPWFDVFDPPMTAIAQPTADIGAAAVAAVLALIAGEPVPTVDLRCRLIVRASCGELVADRFRSARTKPR